MPQDALKNDMEVVVTAVASGCRAAATPNVLGLAAPALQAQEAAVVELAAATRAGGDLVASLQRLAFAACFTQINGSFACPGAGPSSAFELDQWLPFVAPWRPGGPRASLAFEVVRRSTVLLELPPLELVGDRLDTLLSPARSLSKNVDQTPHNKKIVFCRPHERAGVRVAERAGHAAFAADASAGARDGRRGARRAEGRFSGPADAIFRLHGLLHGWCRLRLVAVMQVIVVVV